MQLKKNETTSQEFDKLLVEALQLLVKACEDLKQEFEVLKYEVLDYCRKYPPEP